MMNATRTEQLIQYALLVAGDVGTERGELGRIHLLKYVYLADLAHAEGNAGQTYTGAIWEFYKFGPWQAAVHSQIEPAVAALGAEKRTFDRGGGQHGVRYRAVNESRLAALELSLPARVASAVKKAVREFDSDTHALLDYVYRTRPMVHAAPNTRLDFSLAVRQPTAEYAVGEAPTARETRKHREKVRAMREKLRSRLREDLAQRTRRGGDVGHPPRYDDVFQQGQDWLESLAGAQIEPEGELEFDDAIWQSDGRRDPEIP